MKKDLDIKFSVIQKPKMWIFQVESADEMDDQEGLMAMLISIFKFAENLGIDKETLADAIIDNMENQECFSQQSVVRELPRGDA